MPTYTIQEHVVASGATLKIELTTALTDLVIPSYASLIPKDFREAVDVVVGSSDVEQVDFEYAEDYSTYPDGFWYQIFQANDGLLAVSLDEGSGYVYRFWGDVLAEGVQLEELALGTVVRAGSFKALSILGRLKSVTTADLLVEIIDQWERTTHIDGNPTNYGTPFAFYDAPFSMKRLYAYALHLATGQTMAETDIDCPQNDIEFADGAAPFYGFNDLYFLLHVQLDATGTAYASVQWPVVTWDTDHPTAWDLLWAICKPMGLIMRHRYESGRHKIDLLTRGHSYSTKITLPMPEKSTLIMQEHAVRFIQVGGLVNLYYNVDTEVGGLAMPAGWSPELSVMYELQNRDAIDSVRDFLAYLGPNDYQRLDKIRYWVYTTGGGDWSSTKDHLYEVIPAYFGKRLGGIKRAYDRTYAGTKANDGSTDSIANLTFGRTHDIDDGVAARTFFISELTWNLEDDRADVHFTEV